MGMLLNAVSQVVSCLAPGKSFKQVMEEQTTKTVWYPRVHGLPRKYVYGKVPDEPILKHELHPEGGSWPFCCHERDPVVIRGHIAICAREAGSHGGLCEMCRKLNNPQRRAFLVRLYKDGRPVSQAGFNVGEAVDKSGMSEPATSQYLRQLAALGLIRRERNGRLVHYVPETYGASSCVREIGEMMRARWLADPTDAAFVPILRVMMGAFRAQVVRLLAAGESGSVEALAERFQRKSSDVLRDLDWAVRGGVLNLTSEDSNGVYRYVTPEDPIARRIVELS